MVVGKIQLVLVEIIYICRGGQPRTVSMSNLKWNEIVYLCHNHENRLNQECNLKVVSVGKLSLMATLIAIDQGGEP